MNRRGSVIIEAALLMPLIVVALVSLLSLSQVVQFDAQLVSQCTALNDKIRMAMIAEEEVAEDYRIGSQWVSQVGIEIALDNALVKEAGYQKEALKVSSCLIDAKGLTYQVTYDMPLPISIMGQESVQLSHRFFVQTLSGAMNNAFVTLDGNQEPDKDMVMVTETGTKYHQDPKCRYIHIVARPVPLASLDKSYRLCKRCLKKRGEQSVSTVYLTKSSHIYHYESTCTAIHRTITYLSLKEAKARGYTPCSLCGEGEKDD